MKIEANLEEIQLIRHLLMKEVNYYDLLKNHVEDQDGWIRYDLDQHDYVLLLKKWNEAYQKECKRKGELPF